jgi:COP9 signalosome complex subunit 4
MDDSTQAEVYVNRTKHILHNISDRVLQLRYKQANVQLADSKRDFLIAAQGFFALSLEGGIEQEEG